MNSGHALYGIDELDRVVSVAVPEDGFGVSGLGDLPIGFVADNDKVGLPSVLERRRRVNSSPSKDRIGGEEIESHHAQTVYYFDHCSRGVWA